MLSFTQAARDAESRKVSVDRRGLPPCCSFTFARHKCCSGQVPKDFLWRAIDDSEGKFRFWIVYLGQFRCFSSISELVSLISGSTCSFLCRKVRPPDNPAEPFSDWYSGITLSQVSVKCMYICGHVRDFCKICRVFLELHSPKTLLILCRADTQTRWMFLFLMV